MKILHLNSNFVFTKIYQNQLDNMSNDFEHVIYNPIRKNVNIETHSKYELHIPKNIKNSDSIFSLRRRNRSFKYLHDFIDLQNINLIHAHTLTNDGLLAYSLHKKYNIPYILTIRGTDVNFSIPFKIHLRKSFKNVIKNAGIIIFPNHSYKNKILSFFKGDENIAEKLEESVVIPNGIDPFWIVNAKKDKKKRNLNKEIQLLYVGRILSNKNIHRVLKAVNLINSDGKYFIGFNVVGNIINKKYFEELRKSYSFKYYGSKNKEEIKEIMKNMDVFTMPSKSETFGLVYIEAMSQSLPLIYTKNEGIDGYFSNRMYGVASNYKNVEEIKNNILYILDNYQRFQNNLLNKGFLNEFKWNEIGKIYNSLYKELSR